MATLWVREYQNRGSDKAGRDVQIAFEPGTDQAPLTFSTTAASAAFAASTRFIAILADANFHYVVGAAPTATTGALKVPANTLMWIGVTPGHKIAAIAGT